MSSSEWQANGHRRRKAIVKQKRASQVCYLCGQPIDMTLRTPHPMSFELDHKVPLNDGGSAFDPTNHGSTHRAHNRAKSDGPIDGSKTVPTSRQWL